MQLHLVDALYAQHYKFIDSEPYSAENTVHESNVAQWFFKTPFFLSESAALSSKTVKSSANLIRHDNIRSNDLIKSQCTVSQK